MLSCCLDRTMAPPSLASQQGEQKGAPLPFCPIASRSCIPVMTDTGHCLVGPPSSRPETSPALSVSLASSLSLGPDVAPLGFPLPDGLQNYSNKPTTAGGGSRGGVHPLVTTKPTSHGPARSLCQVCGVWHPPAQLGARVAKMLLCPAHPSAAFGHLIPFRTRECSSLMGRIGGDQNRRVMV